MDNIFPKIEINGKSYRLKFTWGNLLTLKNTYGDEYMGVIQKGLFSESVDVDILFTVLELIGDIPRAEMNDYDGPLLPACMAVATAIKMSYSGWINGEETEESPKLNAADAQ